MSKTVLAQVDGWTPVIDAVVLDVGATAALVFGKAWRYCQMADNVCKASQDRLADELGLSRATINTHLSKLVEAGYLEDMTPDLAGLPHQYRDTGKASLSFSLTGGVSKNSTTTSQKSLQPPVKNIDTKIQVKKQDKKELKPAPKAKLPTPPEVLLFRQVTERYPPKPNFDDVVNSIRVMQHRLQRPATVEDLKPFYASWCHKGYKPINLSWLEWAETGQIPVNGNWKPREQEPAAFEAIRQFEALQHGK